MKLIFEYFLLFLVSEQLEETSGSYCDVRWFVAVPHAWRYECSIGTNGSDDELI